MSQSKANIPVILIHKGYDYDCQAAINQARFFKNDVTCITDNTSLINCNIADIAKYQATSNEFKKHYVELSTCGVPYYELFCFQRWFILFEYMRDNKIDEIFYIDSDVLLYTDVNDDREYFKNYIFTLVLKTAGLASYFSYNGLKSLCMFLMEIYSNKDSYEFAKIASHYHVRQDFKLPGGVCDMTLLEYYGRYKCANGVGEMTFIRDNAVYDHNINESDSFYELDNNIKKIKMIDGLPYCYNSHTKCDIRFKSLHFQGEAKGLIPQYVSYKMS